MDKHSRQRDLFKTVRSRPKPESLSNPDIHAFMIYRANETISYIKTYHNNIYIYIMLFGLIRQHFLNSSFTLLRCIERYSLLLYFSETRIILFRHLSSVRCWSSILGFLGILLCSARQDCNTATSGFGRSAIQTSVMCPLSALNFPALRPFLFGRPSYRWHSWQIFSILKTKSKGR